MGGIFLLVTIICGNQFNNSYYYNRYRCPLKNKRKCNSSMKRSISNNKGSNRKSINRRTNGYMWKRAMNLNRNKNSNYNTLRKRDKVSKVSYPKTNNCENKDIYEVNDIYNLILYALYTHILFIARNVDIDNFDEYLIEREDELKEKLQNGINKLINIFEQNSNMNNISFLLEKNCFELAIEIMIGNIAIINSEDILLLEMDFLCWDELKSRKEMREKVKKYVEEHTRTFSDERKTQCLRRLNEIFVSMERE